MVRAAFARYCLALLLCLPWVLPARAWGPFGHQLVSELTEGMLTREARAFYREILADEKLGDAAVWADQMRADPSPFWQQEAGPYHYVTVPDGQRYDSVPPAPRGDALTALARFAQILATGEASREEQQLALRFSIHIIQDLHQPLHVGNGKDRGGTRYFVRYDGKVLNLHRLWDTEMITDMRRSQSDWLERLESQAVLGEGRAGDVNPLTWVAESQALREQIYPNSKTLDDAYRLMHQEALETRLALAAARTAAWLNQMALRGSPGR